MERFVPPPLSNEAAEALKRKELQVWRDQVQLRWQTLIDDAKLSSTVYADAFEDAVESLPGIPDSGLEEYDEERLAHEFEGHLGQQIGERYLTSAIRTLDQEKRLRTPAYLGQEEREAVGLYKKLIRDCFAIPNLFKKK